MTLNEEQIISAVEAVISALPKPDPVGEVRVIAVERDYYRQIETFAEFAAGVKLEDGQKIYTEAPIAPHASEQKPVALPFAIFDHEIADLRRFHECAMDDEGYDVPKDRMKRLAEIGLVRRVSANYYEHTDFGLSVLNGDFDSQPQPDYKAQRDALLKSVAQVKSNLMHHRRFGDDTFQAWKNSAARAEGDLEEAITSVKGGA